MPEPTAKCRFYTRHANRCTGDAVDAAGEILICQRHLGYAMELLAARGFTITPPSTHRCGNCGHESCMCPSLEQVPYGHMAGEPGFVA